MQSRSWKALCFYVAACAGIFPPAHAQLDDHCTVSVLNRTAQVRADGTWSIDNIPANFGPVRARATCIENGTTRTLQSDLFLMSVGVPTGIRRDALKPNTAPIPVRISITSPLTTLTQPRQTISLTVTGTYADNSTRDLAHAITGTTYTISNPDLATVSADGVVTAKASGTVLIQAANEGAQGLLQLTITLSGDSDGDGIPDDQEIRLGLDPNNPADAQDDPDHDGLSNFDEVRAGTDIHNPDTDGDGLADGREVKVLHTNPLLKDTDGDGVPDNIEVATGSDPVNPASFNLQAALSGIRVSPPAFTIDNNAANGLGAQQLLVTGDFKLGGTIDITAKSRGTTYGSSDSQVCRFGDQDGKVLAGSDGTCVITVTNSGFSATASGAVVNTSPPGISKLPLAGILNGVDAQGNFAYMVAGAPGLLVADISDPAQPRLVSTTDTPGNANEVRIAGNFAYIADGPQGLQIFDVSNPAAPVLKGSLFTNDAQDLVVFDGRAYIADSRRGLVIVDVANPANPTILHQVSAVTDAGGHGFAKGVDILEGPNNKLYAILVEGGSGPTPGFSGLAAIDVTNVASAAVVASLPSTLPYRDVRVAGKFAYALTGLGVDIIDLTDPLAPLLKSSFRAQIAPKDVEIAGNLAILADARLPSTVPILNVSDPVHPTPDSQVDFQSLGQGLSGTGIAVKGPFVYLAATFAGFGQDEKLIDGGNVAGTTGLFIGQYRARQDAFGVAPQVTLAAPAGNSSVTSGSTIALRANATDDVLVDSVTFKVDGVDIFTDDSAPYQALYSVPANATHLTISATARDFGGNIGAAAPVNLSVIPDPLTTVTGQVNLLINGVPTPPAGASVECLGVTGTTITGGKFTITGVSTVQGGITCSAAFTLSGKVLQGKSPLATMPVPGGITTLAGFTLQ